MAFTTTFHLTTEARTWAVQEFHWAIVQNIDEQARPLAGIQGGQLHLALDHLHDPVLDAWMTSPTRLLSGSLAIKAADGSPFRTVRFEDAYCVGEGLHFNATGIGPATTMSILISAQRLEIDGEVSVDNHWPG